MPVMDHAGFCDAAASEARRFVATVDGADPALPVPTCPGWTLTDLMSHLGGIHRWAAQHVATGARRRVPNADVDLQEPDDPAALAAWLAAGIDPMVATFRAGDPDAEVWGWGADRHGRFWARRMVHETMVHRVDAARAVGVEPELDPALAQDAIDELLANLPHAAYFAPAVDTLRGDGESVGLHATDRDVSWRIRLLPAGYAWDWSTDPADAELRATTADLLLAVSGRTAPDDPTRFEPTGDTALLRRFVLGCAL
jgi:uncharacterized protein (TIGR03083 family)